MISMEIVCLLVGTYFWATKITHQSKFYSIKVALPAHLSHETGFKKRDFSKSMTELLKVA